MHEADIRRKVGLVRVYGPNIALPALAARCFFNFGVQETKENVALLGLGATLRVSSLRQTHRAQPLRRRRAKSRPNSPVPSSIAAVLGSGTTLTLPLKTPAWPAKV